MTKYFIKSISIEGFRGINNSGDPLLIEFQTDGVTSFFGENGKGKSSIFEAFLYAILGKILRFDDYHTDIRDKRAIKNLFHSGDGNIIIEFIDDANSIINIDVKIDSNGERTVSSTSIANPEIFLHSLCSSLNFIDYKSFEKIIISSSEDTGKLFSNLVGFSKFIDIKEKLDKISRTQNINNDFGRTLKENSLRINNQKIDELKREILKKLDENGIKIEGYDKKEIVKKLKSFLNKQYKANISKISNDVIIDFDLLLKTKIGSTYEEDALKLNAQKEKLENYIALKSTIKRLTDKSIAVLSSKLKSAYSQIDSNTDIVLGKLYDDALKGYEAIINYDKNSCILCNTGDLGDNRITFYEKIQRKIKAYNLFKYQYSTFLEKFLQKVQSSRIIEYEMQYLTENERFFSGIEKSIDFIPVDFFDNNSVIDIVTNYKENIEDNIKSINSSINDLHFRIPPHISELVEINNAYKFIFNSIIEIDKLQKTNKYDTKYLYELENWTTFINQLKSDYENAYNNLMDEIASMIDFDTKAFFKEIMGDIDITPKLKKENRGQRVNILLEKFYSNTSDLKAAPFLSESYRNALSLSIYFATAIKSRNLGNFIIVDDITSSFDSGHQYYLLDLIKRKISIHSSNKKGKQIIFLTHDGLLKKILNENNSLKNWKHYNLNFNKDIISLKPFNSNDLKVIIQDKINSGNYIGSDFRMYYEFVLLEIIEKLNLEIPFSLINNHDNKLVSKLANAIQEIIELKRKSGKTGAINRRLPSKNDFKSHTQLLTNNLSHWASSSEISLSSPVLNKIIKDIDDFKKIFQYNCTCPSKHMGWVYYNSLTKPNHRGCNCVI